MAASEPAPLRFHDQAAPLERPSCSAVPPPRSKSRCRGLTPFGVRPQPLLFLAARDLAADVLGGLREGRPGRSCARSLRRVDPGTAELRPDAAHLWNVRQGHTADAGCSELLEDRIANVLPCDLVGREAQVRGLEV